MPPRNNEWMSVLEEAAKPILSPMMHGQMTALSVDQQIVVARWLVKTTMMWEFFRQRSPRYYSPSERRAFFQSRAIPAGTSVWLGAYTGESALRMTDDDSNFAFDRLKGDQGSAYMFTMSMGQLAMQIFSHRWLAKHREYGFQFKPFWYTATIDIWPRTLSARHWPPKYGMNDEWLLAFAKRVGRDQGRSVQ